MKFISTSKKTEPVLFSEAAFHGLAPDGGLYFPDSWPTPANGFLRDLGDKNLRDIGLEISRHFIDELDEAQLKSAVADALNFEAPLVHLDENLYLLELFHGPTLAFKDFGARFMSRIFSKLREKQQKERIILAATSGDTGSAVAQGFLGADGIKVCLLYPSGKVSQIQEQQLTTAGQNVTALEVKGTFDDCQRMVKETFADPALNSTLLLSSANSINIARLLPQTFYYFYAITQFRDEVAPIFCVPSGNFGNLTAGLMAQKMGMPCTGFIAATNINDTFPRYLQTGTFSPKASQSTISNAMDVGNPSNFARIQALFDHSREKIKQHVWSASFSDDDTHQAIREIYNDYNYLADPHTAVGYQAAREYQKNDFGYFDEEKDVPLVILSTAHPAKFGNVIEPLIGEKVPVPDRLQACLSKQKKSTVINNNYAELKDWLLSNYHE